MFSERLACIEKSTWVPRDKIESKNSAIKLSKKAIPYCLEKKWGYIDKQVRTVIPPLYVSAYKFENGLARVVIYDYESFSPKLSALINKSGKIIFVFPKVSEADDWSNQ